MARTLLATTCTLINATGAYNQQNTFYDPAKRAAQQAPLVSEETTVITCSPYQIASGQEVDSYCAVDGTGTGVRRKTFTAAGGSGVVQFYTNIDSADGACSGACNLAITYQDARATSSPSATDGSLVIEANTTHPTITVFLAGVGAPTTTQVFNPTSTGSTPRLYQFTYSNLKAGNYVVQMQDAGNCQLSTNVLTIKAGGAPGTGGVGLPTNINWFKYQYQRSTTNNGGDEGTITGYAWDKTTKAGYVVPPIKLTYPPFLSRLDYQKGDVVGYVRDGEDQRFYYRASVDLLRSDMRFSAGTPPPSADNVPKYWEMLNMQYSNALEFRRNGILLAKLYNEFYQSKTSYQNGEFHYFYPKDTVVRYDWTGFYRAKYDLESNLFPKVTIPPPTVGASNNEWEKVEGYDFFYYAIPEPQVIDQYPSGKDVRRIRYHVDIPGVVEPIPANLYALAPDSDFILADDSTPAVETAYGDLKVIDIIKTDVDVAGVENGSVWVMATSPSLPIKYHLRNGVRAGYIQDNQTGKYENLHPGGYVVDIYDAENRYVTAEFTIEDRYQARWKLTFDDYKGNSLETFIFQRDWTGGVTDVIGTDEPTILSWDNGGDPGGALPEATGANLEFNLYTQVAQQFVDTVLKDDRNHRVDHYRNGKLHFRGYVDTQTYQEALLGTAQKVTVVATDGLGQLKNTKFINHLSQRQTARTSQLSIILKILSFTDVNLPLWCSLNLRDKLMTATGDPLNEAYVHRSAYIKKDDKVIADEDLIDCRTVLDAILRLYNSQMQQVDGRWEIISLNEVQGDYETRVWSPAGVLQTGVDTLVKHLRILPPDFSTGPRELSWRGATQTRTTMAAGQIVKAVVALQLEENLFENGNFIEWNLDRPSYWTTNGILKTSREKGEKAKEYALKFSRYDNVFTANNYIVSPPVPHVQGIEEDYMLLKIRAFVDPATTNPADVTVLVYFQFLSSGAPYGDPISVEMNSKDKWKDYEVYAPFGVLGDSVRVRVLEPVAVAGTGTVRLNSVALSIQPGLVDWKDAKEDHFEVTNPTVQTGVRLPDLELVHADLPLLPAANGTALPAKKMDVYAWRHAVSLADYSATTAWKRPTYKAYATLLENAAQDRLALRFAPSTVVTGEVAGPGIEFLRQGIMLDMPFDLDGRYLVVSCFRNERKGTAQITVRKLADGDYGGVLPAVPNKARIATNNGKKGYRISYLNSQKGFRIAEM